MASRPSRTYNVHEAKTHLSRLLEQAADGEDVIIAKAGVPVARLVAVTRPAVARGLGSEQGRLLLGSDFDAPLPARVQESFDE